MNHPDLPEVFCHLDHLPPIDQYFINGGQNSVFKYPSVDYPEGKTVKYKLTGVDGITNTVSRVESVIPTPAAVQRGEPSNLAGRHEHLSRTVLCASDFVNTKFAQDAAAALGEVKSLYLYHPPWRLYDWHRDISRHECAINWVLTDAPESRTLFRFPTDCELNYQVSLLDYKVYRPVLIRAKTEHCIANLSNKHRYLLTLILLDTTYEKAKEYFLNYQMSSTYL